MERKESAVIWITGLPGSGKSTISRLLSRRINAEWLRLDEIRKIITPEPSYTHEEKLIVYRSLAFIAGYLAKKGFRVVVDATDETGEGRRTLRKIVRDIKVVQLECSKEERIKREEERKDSAGVRELYERALRGEIRLAGVNAPYKKEESPAVMINTEEKSPDEAVEMIVKEIGEING